MIPFTEPFTAPDGTTRRPLCERVPEIRPNLDATACAVPPLEALNTILWREGMDDWIEPIAAALWRVRVEDWLLKFNRQHDLIVNVKIHKDGDLALAAMWQEAQGDQMKFQFALSPSRFKDFNAALNATAHIIADALSISP